MIAAQVAAKATRDALFLGRYEARHLPLAMLAGGAGAVLSIFAFSHLMRRYGPQAVVPAAFAVSASGFVGEWLLWTSFPAATIWMLYLHIATLGGVVISGFWSMYTEAFDPATAKRLIGKVGAAASLGGLLGAGAAERFAAAADVPTTLLLLAVMNLATGAGAVMLGRNTVAREPAKAPEKSTLAILRNNPYLKNIALLVGLYGLAGALMDFAFKAQADAELADQGTLLQFFAAFYAITSLLTFVAQAFLTKRVLSRFGIAMTVAMLPMSMVLFSALGAAVTRLWSIVLLRGVGAVVGHSMYRPGYELLYTPIPREKKRSTKTVIDVAFNRFGDILGGLVVLLVVFVLPTLAVKISLVIAGGLGLAGLVVAWRLHGGYVGALAESLRSGAVVLDDGEFLDKTTRHTFADTMALGRNELLAEIKAFERDKARPPEEPTREPVPGRTAVEPSLRVAADALMSDDIDAVKEILTDASSLAPQLGPLILPWVTHKETRAVARSALETLAPRVVGQLHDALMDRGQPRAVRSAAASVLRGYPHPRSADALLDGLSSERLALRYRCGQGLVAIAATHPETVRVDKTTIHQRVLAELADGSAGQESEPQSEIHQSEPAGWLDDAVRKHLNRKIEHAFSLLSLVYDGNALQLSLRAIQAKDTALRGTALEYLDSVLPAELKAAVWGHLHVEHPRHPAQRAHKEVLDELMLSVDGLKFDAALLKAPRSGGSDT